MKEQLEPIEYGKSELLYRGKNVALIGVGNMVEVAVDVHDMLQKKGMDITLVNARFIKPFDEEMLKMLAKEHDIIVTLEEHVFQGGFGQAVSAFYMNSGFKDSEVVNFAIDDSFGEHGSVTALRKKLGIDAESVARLIEDRIDAE